jgi:hypothetical protein
MKGPASGYLYANSGPSRVLALLESGPQTMAEMRAVLPAWVRVSSILWSEEKRGRVVVLSESRPLRYVLA